MNEAASSSDAVFRWTRLARDELNKRASIDRLASRSNRVGLGRLALPALSSLNFGRADQEHSLDDASDTSRPNY